MNRTLFVLAAASAAIVGLGVAPAVAQVPRTFVSGQGSDGNPCSLPAPCRTFARAATQTSAGGEITVLDSAGYGSVTITQSLTITNPGGVEAGITPASGEDAITISTGAAAVITLRGLTLEGSNTGRHGINLSSVLPNSAIGGTLNVIGCVVKDFTNNGILVHPGLAGSGGVPTLKVLIADSFFLNNGTNGIKVSPGTVNITPSIDRTVVSGNAGGINLASSSAGVNALLVDSHIDNNTSGITLSGTTSITMKSSTANFADFGSFDITTSANVILYNENTIGLINNNGNVFTDGTNNIGFVNGNALIRQNPQ